MGGITIADIITKNKEKLDKIDQIVVSPNNDFYAVRSEITKLGFIIDKEELLALVKEITETDEYDCSAKAIDDYIDVINDYNKRQEIKRLNEMIRKENDPIEKSKIAEQIRLIKIGESKNG